MLYLLLALWFASIVLFPTTTLYTRKYYRNMLRTMELEEMGKKKGVTMELGTDRMFRNYHLLLTASCSFFVIAFAGFFGFIATGLLVLEYVAG